jgi:hypothetical protein
LRHVHTANQMRKKQFGARASVLKIDPSASHLI